VLTHRITFVDRDDSELPESPLPFAFGRVVQIVIAVELGFYRGLALLHNDALTLDLKEEMLVLNFEISIRMDAFLLEVGLLPIERESVCVAKFLAGDMETGNLELMVNRAFRVIVKRLSAKFFDALTGEAVGVPRDVGLEVEEFKTVYESGSIK